MIHIIIACSLVSAPKLTRPAALEDLSVITFYDEKATFLHEQLKGGQLTPQMHEEVTRLTEEITASIEPTDSPASRSLVARVKTLPGIFADEVRRRQIAETELKQRYTDEARRAMIDAGKLLRMRGRTEYISHLKRIQEEYSDKVNRETRREIAAKIADAESETWQSPKAPKQQPQTESVLKRARAFATDFRRSEVLSDTEWRQASRAITELLDELTVAELESTDTNAVKAMGKAKTTLMSIRRPSSTAAVGAAVAGDAVAGAAVAGAAVASAAVAGAAEETDALDSFSDRLVRADWSDEVSASALELGIMRWSSLTATENVEVTARIGEVFERSSHALTSWLDGRMPQYPRQASDIQAAGELLEGFIGYISSSLSILQSRDSSRDDLPRLAHIFTAIEVCRILIDGYQTEFNNYIYLLEMLDQLDELHGQAVSLKDSYSL